MSFHKRIAFYEAICNNHFNSLSSKEDTLGFSNVDVPDMFSKGAIRA